MPNQSLPSREAETTIQNVVQNISSGVEPSIRKASGAHGAPRSTVGHYLAGRLPRHEAHPGLLHPLQEEQIIKWINECQPWAFR